MIRVDKKFRQRRWIAIGVTLLGLGLWGVLKHTYCKQFRCGTQDSSGVSTGGASKIKNYELRPSPEVLKALEERKKHPLKVKNSDFRGLSSAPDLGTERLILRAIEERDLDDLMKSFSDYDTVYMLAFMPWPFDRNRTLTYMKNLSWNMDHGNSLYWAITLPEKDSMMGVIGLTLEHEHDRAELHYWLEKEYRNRGYMTEAAKRIVDYVFKDLNMNRLDVNHLNVNLGSQRVLEKCGFTLECEKEGFCKKEGKYENMKFYRILRREYPRI
ncbi:MAG: GNAT family N-acetyltransferase [Puniceicoccales bacterium]|jgi:RimJ/RimL family protein N-acetyltransferase|nr:GNAT family N-acetyltransferase [Puniceicoccales bacterium]